MLIAAAAAGLAAATKPQEAPSTPPAAKVVSRNPPVWIDKQPAFHQECPGLQRAITRHRQQYRRNRARMGLSGPVSRVWYGCGAAARRAKEWRHKAIQAREALRRWLARPPVGETAIRRYMQTILPDDEYRCLAAIIDAETAGTWSPTIWNRQGSGAYGLPQALPGHKMASAGGDWATNPRTQIRWLIGYAIERYGGPCEAYWYRERHGTY